MRLRLLLYLVGLLIVGLSVYIIVSAVTTSRDTGILHISSSDPNASLIIGQNNTGSVFLGKGNARVRLKPGAYEASASDNGYQTLAVVQIRKAHTTVSALTLVLAAESTSSGGLFNELPFLGPASEYQISKTTQVSNNNSGPVLVITAPNTKAREDALDWITSQGYNPTVYTIKYENTQLVDYHYTEGLP